MKPSATAAARGLLSLLAVCAAALPLPSAAQETGAVERPWKLTFGDYFYSDGYAGQDVNLRWRRQGSSAWIGSYHDRVFGSQARAGVDTSIPLPLGTGTALQPSLQAASGGFRGGSFNLMTGDPWFALLGWGRTNLRPYFNLNFDPNDTVTAGAGWHGSDGRTVSLVVIADDRLHTGQKHWHLYGHWPASDELRVTLDLLRKTGEGDGGPVHAWGLGATFDFPTWFLRLARDPKQNFSTQDATRISAGVRF